MSRPRRPEISDRIKEFAYAAGDAAGETLRTPVRPAKPSTRRMGPPRGEAGRTGAPVAAVGYIRVSTEEQGESGLGLEAQASAIRAACQHRGWAIIGLCSDVASGKSLEHRDGLEEALEAVRGGAAKHLVVAKLDRLSRSVIDAAVTIERARREGWNLVALDLGVDFSTPTGEAMANMTATFAQLERRLIGERTREALAAARARGVRLGRPVEVTPEAEELILGFRKQGLTARAIAELLSRSDHPAPRGGVWHHQTVARILARHGAQLKRGRPTERRRRGRTVVRVATGTPLL